MQQLFSLLDNSENAKFFNLSKEGEKKKYSYLFKDILNAENPTIPIKNNLDIEKSEIASNNMGSDIPVSILAIDKSFASTENLDNSDTSEKSLISQNQPKLFNLKKTSNENNPSSEFISLNQKIIDLSILSGVNELDFNEISKIDLSSDSSLRLFSKNDNKINIEEIFSILQNNENLLVGPLKLKGEQLNKEIENVFNSHVPKEVVENLTKQSETPLYFTINTSGDKKILSVFVGNQNSNLKKSDLNKPVIENILSKADSESNEKYVKSKHNDLEKLDSDLELEKNSKFSESVNIIGLNVNPDIELKLSSNGTTLNIKKINFDNSPINQNNVNTIPRISNNEEVSVTNVIGGNKSNIHELKNSGKKVVEEQINSKAIEENSQEESLQSPDSGKIDKTTILRGEASEKVENANVKSKPIFIGEKVVEEQINSKAIKEQPQQESLQSLDSGKIDKTTILRVETSEKVENANVKSKPIFIGKNVVEEQINSKPINEQPQQESLQSMVSGKIDKTTILSGEASEKVENVNVKSEPIFIGKKNIEEQVNSENNRANTRSGFKDNKNIESLNTQVDRKILQKESLNSLNKESLDIQANNNKSVSKNILQKIFSFANQEGISEINIELGNESSVMSKLNPLEENIFNSSPIISSSKSNANFKANVSKISKNYATKTKLMKQNSNEKSNPLVNSSEKSLYNSIEENKISQQKVTNQNRFSEFELQFSNEFAKRVKENLTKKFFKDPSNHENTSKDNVAPIFSMKPELVQSDSKAGLKLGSGVGINSQKSLNDNQSENSLANKNDSKKQLFNGAIKAENTNVKFEIPSLNTESGERINQQQIINEITKTLSKATKKQTVEIKIAPKELGSIKIVIDVADKVLNTKIEVENEQVQQLLNNNLDTLKQNLQQSGIMLSSFNISLNQHSQNKFAGQMNSKKNGNSQSNKIEKESARDIEDKKDKNLGYNTYEFVV